jgi:GNAT superfamily N-acetyltransferase
MVTVRRAEPGDGPPLLALVEALARYERLPPPDPAARERLLRDLFGPRPRMEAFLAEDQGAIVGYAFVFESYSSFLALPTLYLEDLFVLPESRSRGAGGALFRHVVAEAHRRGCGRVEFSVLHWNELARQFYDRLGARHMKEWQLFRLSRDEMEALLARPPGEGTEDG